MLCRPVTVPIQLLLRIDNYHLQQNAPYLPPVYSYTLSISSDLINENTRSILFDRRLLRNVISGLFY